jgi:vacuolar-type H+-ATPase subunit I/STV1
MWDDQKRKRFNEHREPGRQLDAAEQAEVAALVKEVEDMEAVYLKPATERLRRENERRAKRNREMAELIQRKEALVGRLENILAEAQAEERAIETELAPVAASGQDSNSDD